MKRMLGKAAIWGWLILVTAAVAAAGQDPLPPALVLPEGEGKALIENTCKSCHNLNGIGRRAPMDKDGWKSLIATMVEYGAVLDEAQVTTMVDYLTKNFGPKDGAAGGATPSAAADEVTKKLMTAACTGCHDAELVTSQKKDKMGWETTIKSMIGKGAAVTNDEVPVLLEYLVRLYGTPTQ